MKTVKERTWSGDLEIVYEESKPYKFLLEKLSSIASPVLQFENIHEEWFRDANGEIDIQTIYTSAHQSHSFWTERRGDYLNMNVLFLMNLQLKLTKYKFEYSYEQESVYFINAHEKLKLQDEGVVFEEYEAQQLFDFILYNILEDLNRESNNFTYELIKLLTNELEEYHHRNWSQKTFSNVQDIIRTNLLSKLNFEKTAEMGIEVEKLYAFTEK